MSKNKIEFPDFKLKGKNIKVGVALARWNTEITESLMRGVVQALKDARMLSPGKNFAVLDVPGSFELPRAAQKLFKEEKVDVVIALGCLIKGETMHFEYIADAVSNGLMRVSLDAEKPVVFGVLTCLNEKQAKARATGKNNHGYSWGLTAIEMALTNKRK